MPDNAFSSLLKRLKGTWNKLAGAGAWLLLIISAFLRPPPVGADQFGGDGALAAFGRFVVPLCVGLILVPLVRWDRKRHTWAWWKAGAAALVLSVIAFFGYQWLVTSWTCTYDHKLVVIGSEFMPGREKWAETNGIYNEAKDWIMAHGGRLEQIWTAQSIQSHCAILAAVYLLSLPLFALALICIIQAMFCNSRKS